jgi:hypothetical protein
MNGPANAPFGGWLQLASITNGQGCAKGLIAGGTYDFKLPVPNESGQLVDQSFSNEFKQPKGVTIPTTGNFSVTIKSNLHNFDQTFTIKNQGNGIYDLEYLNNPLTPKACEDLNKKFSVYIVKK